MTGHRAIAPPVHRVHTHRDFSNMNNENLFTAALNALTNNGCPSDLAQEAASIVANDDPYQPDLGRTPEQQQIIREALPYLQSGIYDQFETIDETPNPLTHGQFLGNFGSELPDETIWRLGEGDSTALNDITDDATRDKANNIFTRLEELGAWE
ncbi:hypothetical protein [Nostoc sp. UHCC 0870]|uniref:hypothetical protein n=1 Tax=Nostoc sp. UHCC 0870 TaxID=2914041 RepID=UPI001EDE757F|nr:hypothetical protein [Nostoc sp. UHCC 0870]UKP01435.1 hypothetical protein L6494_29860 [Nostoc sp. UHCC 0870]